MILGIKSTNYDKKIDKIIHNALFKNELMYNKQLRDEIRRQYYNITSRILSLHIKKNINCGFLEQKAPPIVIGGEKVPNYYVLRKYYALSEFARERIQHGIPISIETKRIPKPAKKYTLKHRKNEIKKTLTRLLFHALLFGSIEVRMNEWGRPYYQERGGFSASDLVNRRNQRDDRRFAYLQLTERKVLKYIREFEKEGIIFENVCTIKDKELLYSLKRDHPLYDFILECETTINEVRRRVELVWKYRGITASEKKWYRDVYGDKRFLELSKTVQNEQAEHDGESKQSIKDRIKRLKYEIDWEQVFIKHARVRLSKLVVVREKYKQFWDIMIEVVLPKFLEKEVQV